MIQIGTSSSTAPADGASKTAVFADVGDSVQGEDRTVTFTTNLSTFVQGGGTEATATPTGTGGRATVDLLSPKILGTARVTAAVKGFADETTIVFRAAGPDAATMTLTPAALEQESGDSSRIEVTLERLPGRGFVTGGQAMIYTAVEKGTTTELALVFSEQTLTIAEDDAKTKATAKVSLGTETFEGVATIQARVEGSSVVAEQDLEIQPKS